MRRGQYASGMTEQGPPEPPSTPPPSDDPAAEEPNGDEVRRRAAALRLPAIAKTAPVNKPMHLMHIWQFQAFRDLLLVATVLAIIWIGYELSAVTVPLLVALLLAYLFEPLIARISQHRKISRTTAVSSVMIVFGGGLLIVLVLAVPIIVGQTTRFIDHIADGGMRRNLSKLEAYLPEALEEDYRAFLKRLPAGRRSSASGSEPDGFPRSIDEPAPELEGEGPAPSRAVDPEDAGPQDDADESAAAGEEAAGTEQAETGTEEAEADWMADAIAAEVARQLAARATGEDVEEPEPVPAPATTTVRPDDGERIDSAVLGLARRGVQTGVTIVGSVIGLGFMVFLVFFYLFFFSVWYPDVVAFVEKLIPEKNKPRTLELLKKMDNVVAGFVRGRIVISIIMGVMLAVGWMICGVPYAIPVGLLVGVFCAVPYLGFVGVPLAVALLFYGQLDNPPDQRMAWWGILLWPTLVFALVQVFEGYVLTPVIAGKATNLDPVTILVAVLAGGSVLGVYGMLLAIPVAACLKIIISEVLLPRIRAWMRGEIADPLPIERE